MGVCPTHFFNGRTMPFFYSENTEKEVTPTMLHTILEVKTLGFPDVQALPESQKQEFLQTILNDILELCKEKKERQENK